MCAVKPFLVISFARLLFFTKAVDIIFIVNRVDPRQSGLLLLNQFESKARDFRNIDLVVNGINGHITVLAYFNSISHAELSCRSLQSLSSLLVSGDDRVGD